MRNENFVKTFLADEAIAQFTIVKVGSADGYVGVADAGTDRPLGIADSLGADAAGDRVDVVMGGIATCKAGDTIAYGAAVTAEANGLAVTGAAGNFAIGYALNAAADGDLIGVWIAPHTVHA